MLIRRALWKTTPTRLPVQMRNMSASTTKHQSTAAKSSSSSAMGGKAFSDSSFDVDRYLSNRPRYPPHLYEWVRKYVSSSVSKGSGTRTLLDVGCGPGFAAFPLLQRAQDPSPHFDSLIGVDTSASMVSCAPGAFESYKQGTTAEPSCNNTRVQFHVGSSDSMPFLPDHSVDVSIAATAAHWFEYKSTWTELSRVMAPGGAVVWWTYGEHFLPDHVRLASRINAFMQGGSPGSASEEQDQESIGPYFEQPGRGRLTNLLRDLPFPNDPTLALGEELTTQWDASSAIRKTHPMLEDTQDGVAKVDLSYFANRTFTQRQGQSPAEPFRLEQVMNWDQYEGYIRTSSALHSYLKVHPRDKQGGEGDIASRFVSRLKREVLEDRKVNNVGTQEGLDEDHVRVAWPLGLMAIKKKQ